MQQTNFPFVAVIVDDASTDGEQEVIRKYVDEHFDHSQESDFKEWETEDAFWTFAQHIENRNCHFVVIYLKKNLYGNPKKKEIIKPYLQSKYIAICEGDDYWTNPLKLQKQVVFMEEHPDYSMCCHSVDWCQETKLIKHIIKKQNFKSDIDLCVDDIISQGGFYINLCSILYRANLARNTSAFQKIASVGDHPLYIKLALQGKVRSLHEVMGVYRCMVNGGWSDRNYNNDKIKAEHFYNTMLWMKSLDEETKGKHKKAIMSLIGGLYPFTYQHGGFPSHWEYLKLSKFAGRPFFIRACKNVLIERFPHLYAVFRNSYKMNQ